jgi:hypothetical protein
MLTQSRIAFHFAANWYGTLAVTLLGGGILDRFAQTAVDVMAFRENPHPKYLPQAGGRRF